MSEANKDLELGAVDADAEAEKEAKRKAAEEARAARAAARAAAEAEAAAAAPKEPSPLQPLLDQLVNIVRDEVGSKAIAEAYVNETGAHVPTIVVQDADWANVAPVLRDHEALKLEYLRNITGVDYETHMECVYHLINLTNKQTYAVKVRTNRDEASIPSAVAVWATADWNEREIYDLLGIQFPGHPNMTRIMLTDDWVGHPLRKDYEQIDSEV
jgi:NADH-quinone oxidoreductase subunit C